MGEIYASIIAAALSVTFMAQNGAAAPKTAFKTINESARQPAALAREGDKNPLPGGGWFTWTFDKKPRLGPVIIKIQIYSGDKKRDSSYEITGESGMPSMRDHDSGQLNFLLNKKGDYLLPINVVMTGDWRIVIRIKKNGKEVFSGKADFHV